MCVCVCVRWYLFFYFGQIFKLILLKHTQFEVFCQKKLSPRKCRFNGGMSEMDNRTISSMLAVSQVNLVQSASSIIYSYDHFTVSVDLILFIPNSGCFKFARWTFQSSQVFRWSFKHDFGFGQIWTKFWRSSIAERTCMRRRVLPSSCTDTNKWADYSTRVGCFLTAQSTYPHFLVN